MTRVHVWGAAGYAGGEAARWLHLHPRLSVGVLESRSFAGECVAEHVASLRAAPYRFAGPGSILACVRDGDAAIVAGSEADALEMVPRLLAAGVRVVDLSSAYRFDQSAAYGLTEWNASAIAAASLVANPGCYPTAALLALLPLQALRRPPLQIVVDAKSGITGAGRTPSLGSLFAEVDGEIRAYGLSGHRHDAEIQAQLGASRLHAPLVFTPHVVPLARGILVDAYAIFDRPVDAGEVTFAYRRVYESAPFVRLFDAERAPSVAAVVGTNDAELRVDVRGAVVRAICAIDNLGKGAAGQAVANLNLMFGCTQETGLREGDAVA